jgi:hypothetical protein
MSLEPAFLTVAFLIAHLGEAVVIFGFGPLPLYAWGMAFLVRRWSFRRGSLITLGIALIASLLLTGFLAAAAMSLCMWGCPA